MRGLWLCLGLLLLCGGLANGQIIGSFPQGVAGGGGGGTIVFVSAADLGTNGGSGPFSNTFTAVGGATHLMVLGIIGATPNNGDNITTVTYNGVAMTLCGKVIGQPSQDRGAYLYYLINPSAGSNTVAIGETVSDYILAQAAEYSGISGSGQPDASTTHISSGTSTGITTTLSSVTNNAWEILYEEQSANAGGPTAGTGAVRRAVDTTFGAGGIFDSGGPISPAGSYSMTTAGGSGSSAIVHIACDFRP